MAERKGYMHVEKTEHIIFENAGDLSVKIENIRWMTDNVLHPPSFVSVCNVIISELRSKYTIKCIHEILDGCIVDERQFKTAKRLVTPLF